MVAVAAVDFVLVRFARPHAAHDPGEPHTLAAVAADLPPMLVAVRSHIDNFGKEKKKLNETENNK